MIAQFEFDWQGDRFPKAIIFPDGREYDVAHMENGIVNLVDGPDGTYSRISDHSAEFTFVEGMLPSIGKPLNLTDMAISNLFSGTGTSQHEPPKDIYEAMVEGRKRIEALFPKTSEPNPIYMVNGKATIYYMTSQHAIHRDKKGDQCIYFIREDKSGKYVGIFHPDWLIQVEKEFPNVNLVEFEFPDPYLWIQQREGFDQAKDSFIHLWEVPNETEE